MATCWLRLPILNGCFGQDERGSKAGTHSPKMLSKQRRITQAPSLALACCCAWATAFLRMKQQCDAASPWHGACGTERRLARRHSRQGFCNIWCQATPFHQLHGGGLVQIAACLWLPLIVQGCSALNCLDYQRRYRVVGSHLQLCKHGPCTAALQAGPIVATPATLSIQDGCASLRSPCLVRWAPGTSLVLSWQQTSG